MKYWRWGKITFTPRAPVKMSLGCQHWAPDWKDRCSLSSWWPFTSPFSAPFHLEALFFLLVLGKNLLISFLFWTLFSESPRCFLVLLRPCSVVQYCFSLLCYDPVLIVICFTIYIRCLLKSLSDEFKYFLCTQIKKNSWELI